jgi:Cation transporter/ATPase, N-terminus
MAPATAAALPAEDVLARLGSSAAGLSGDEAARRLRAVGPNAVRSHRARALPVLMNQLRSPLLVLLLGFQPLPGPFFLALILLVISYLVLIELDKYWFYRSYRPPAKPAAPRAALRPRRLRRRAARFTTHHHLRPQSTTR